MVEEWRNIPGFEDFYSISNLGRVKSLARVVKRDRSNGLYQCKERILKPSFADGYPNVTLSREGSTRSFKVHVLVMLTFVGPRPAGMDIAHGDGNSRNPRLDNLRYATRAENIQDAVKHGTWINGEKNGQSKISDIERSEIKRLVTSGMKQKEVATKFGISQPRVSHIVNNWS